MSDTDVVQLAKDVLDEPAQSVWSGHARMLARAVLAKHAELDIMAMERDAFRVDCDQLRAALREALDIWQARWTPFEDESHRIEARIADLRRLLGAP
jgi:hypothetical protein